MNEKADMELLEQAAQESVTRAAAYAHATMQSSGHWLTEMRANVSFTSQYILLRSMLGVNPVSEQEKTKLRIWIEAQQHPHGFWGQLPGDQGEEDLGISVEGYWALKMLGVRPEEPHMQAARRCILNKGGVAKVGITVQLNLALVGLLPWSELPQVPPELILMPNSGFVFNVYSMACWARCAAITIFVLRHHESVYHGVVPPDFLDELWISPNYKRMEFAPSLSQSWKSGKYVDLAGGLVDKSLGLMEPVLRRMPTRSSALAKCIRFILDRLDGGGFSGLWSANYGGILALLAEGFSVKHPAVVHLIQATDQYLWEDHQGLRMQITHGPIWDTGLMGLGLLESGLQTEAMTLTSKWFKDRQILDVKGDCHLLMPKLTMGGWPFQNCNTRYPDNDDTLVSLLFIVMHRPEELTLKPALAAIDFLLGMQCSNGGWACFDAWNNQNTWMNKTPFGQGNEFFDPCVPDITGRILECFGLILEISDNYADKTGERLLSNMLALRLKQSSHRAIKYLESVQSSEGLWWSRWHVNYLNGTYSVLCGLKFFLHEIGNSMGIDFVERMIEQPLEWIKSVQNDDGGWGESVSTYRGETPPGRGVSTPTQTAWAIMGLLAHLSPTDVSIVRGIEYLVNTQTKGSYVNEEDGIGIGPGAGATWRQKEYVSVGFPDIIWLDFASSRHGYPMMALGRWLHAMRGH